MPLFTTATKRVLHVVHPALFTTQIHWHERRRKLRVRFNPNFGALRSQVRSHFFLLHCDLVHWHTLNSGLRRNCVCSLRRFALNCLVSRLRVVNFLLPLPRGPPPSPPLHCELLVFAAPTPLHPALPPAVPSPLAMRRHARDRSRYFSPCHLSFFLFFFTFIFCDYSLSSLNRYDNGSGFRIVYPPF